MSDRHPAPHSRSSHPAPPPPQSTWLQTLKENFSLTLVLKNLQWLGEPFVWLPALAISLATLGAWMFWKSPDRWTAADRDPDRVDWLSLLDSQPDEDSVAADIDSSNVLATELVTIQAQRRSGGRPNRSNKPNQGAETDSNTSEAALSDILKLLSLTGSGPVGSRSPGGQGTAANGRSGDRFVPNTNLGNGLSTGGLSNGGLSTGGLSTGGLSNGGLNNGPTPLVLTQNDRLAQPVSPLQSALDRLYLNGADPSGNSSGTGSATSPNGAGSTGNGGAIGNSSLTPGLPYTLPATAPGTAAPNAPASGGFGGPASGLPGYPSYLPGANSGSFPGAVPAGDGMGTLPKVPMVPNAGYGSTAPGAVPLNAGYNTVPNTPAIAPAPNEPAAAPEPTSQPSSSNIGGQPVRTFSNPW